MLLPVEFKEEFINFTNSKIEFHIKHKKFRVNNLWLDEIEESIFHSKIYEFVDNLKAILISCNNNLLIVDEIKTILQHKISFYKSNKIENFSSFLNFKDLIEGINYDIEYDVPEIYNLDYVINYNQKDDKIEDLILYCLINHKSRTKNYKVKLDFEKVKLFFILNQHYKSLLFFEQQIDNIKNAIQVYGVTDLSHYSINNKVSDDKCNLKFDKISSAYVFKFLFESKFISMDLNEGRSESKIKKFAETYFNYTDSNGHIKPLTDVSKEYSKLKGSSKKDKQIEVLDKLSKAIETKRAFLK